MYFQYTGDRGEACWSSAVPASQYAHPEFGLLCPTPRFRRRLHLALAGLVVGARAKSEAAGDLCEMIELPEHPWFFGCQFHPEFTSNPRRGHPLFIGFVRAALARQRHATSGSDSDAVAELVASI